MVTDKFATQVTVLCAFLLYFKIFFVNMGIGNFRNKTGTRAPEDTYQGDPKVIGAQELEELNAQKERFERMRANDLENIPYTMILALLSLMCVSGSTTAATAHVALMIAFTVFRFSHTFFYYKGVSVARSISWLFGTFCSIGFGVNGLTAVF
mmetsp:Transcript_23076/g.32551  ORF Transcript_23076/g.32551 Transcript_23076/m.32551 type:complete len:152 (-) Transcript_23076:188-643(-)